LSPFNFANSVIGRAWTLMSINLADSRLGETFMGSQGHNLNYNNMCCAANEVRPASEETVIMLKAFPALRSAATLVMDPLVAKGLKDQGFKTKQDFSRWLSENVKIPAEQYWGADIIYAFVAPLARQGIEPFASWSKLPKDAPIAP